jgi:hypothetical protein
VRGQQFSRSLLVAVCRRAARRFGSRESNRPVVQSLLAEERSDAGSQKMLVSDDISIIISPSDHEGSDLDRTLLGSANSEVTDCGGVPQVTMASEFGSAWTR